CPSTRLVKAHSARTVSALTPPSPSTSRGTGRRGSRRRWRTRHRSFFLPEFGPAPVAAVVNPRAVAVVAAGPLALGTLALRAVFATGGAVFVPHTLGVLGCETTDVGTAYDVRGVGVVHDFHVTHLSGTPFHTSEGVCNSPTLQVALVWPPGQPGSWC